MGANQGTHRSLENTQAESEWIANPKDDSGCHRGIDITSKFTESYVHQLAYRRNSGRQEEEKVSPKLAEHILKDPKKSYVEKLVELRGMVGVYRLNLLRDEANRQRNQFCEQPKLPFVDTSKIVTINEEIERSRVMENERYEDTGRSLKPSLGSGEVRNPVQSDSEGRIKSNSHKTCYNKSDIVENIKTTVLKDGKNQGKDGLSKPSRKLRAIKKGYSGANAPKSDESKNIITKKMECETQTLLSLSNISAKDDSSAVNFEHSKSKSIGCETQSSLKLLDKHDSNSKIVQNVSTDTINKREFKIMTDKTKSSEPLDSSTLKKCTCIPDERSIHNVSSCETMQSHKILYEIMNQNGNKPIRKSLIDPKERCNLQRRPRDSSGQLRKPSESKIQRKQKMKQKVQKEQDKNKTKCGSSLKLDSSRHRDFSLVDREESVLSVSSCATSVIPECLELDKVCCSTGCTFGEGHRLKQYRSKSESSEKTLESPTPPSMNELIQTIQESTEMNKETCKCTSSCLTKKSPPRVKLMFFPNEERKKSDSRKTRRNDFEDFVKKNKDDDNSRTCMKANYALDKFVNRDRKLSDTCISDDYYSDLMKISCKSKCKDSIEDYYEKSYNKKSIFSDCNTLRENLIRSAKRKEDFSETRCLGSCDASEGCQRSQMGSLTARKCCVQCPCATKDSGRKDSPPASNESTSEATLLSVRTARRRRAENLGSRCRKNMDMYLEMEKLGLGWIRHGEWIPAVKMASNPQEKILPTCCCATK